MARHALRAALVAALALVLSGCIRYSASYIVQSDGTVDGSVFVYLKEGYQTAGDPYYGTQADVIAASFDNATITEIPVAGWWGFAIDFTDEPLATFAWEPDAAWKLQIVKDGAQYVARGFSGEYTADQVGTIMGEEGYMYVTVAFPGALVEQYGAIVSGTSDAGVGYAYFDILTLELAGTGQAYARANPGWVLAPLEPGVIDDLFPADPLPMPATPAPAVTVTLTPPPVVTPAPSLAPGATPSPSALAGDEKSGSDESSIPAWVWGVGGVLVVALAGLIGYTAANRKPKVAAPAAEATLPSPKAETPKGDTLTK